MNETIKSVHKMSGPFTETTVGGYIGYGVATLEENIFLWRDID